jgi:hypothetical protein
MFSSTSIYDISFLSIFYNPQEKLNLSPAIMVRGGVSASDAVLKSFYGDALGESIIMCCTYN